MSAATIQEKPMAHWHEVFNGVHVHYCGARGPGEGINDPQRRANDTAI